MLTYGGNSLAGVMLGPSLGGLVMNSDASAVLSAPWRHVPLMMVNLVLIPTFPGVASFS